MNTASQTSTTSSSIKDESLDDDGWDSVVPLAVGIAILAPAIVSVGAAVLPCCDGIYGAGGGGGGSSSSSSSSCCCCCGRQI